MLRLGRTTRWQSVVGGIQVLGLVGGRLGWQGGFWDTISGLNDHFNEIGFAMGVFIVAWIVSLTMYRYARAEVGVPALRFRYHSAQRRRPP
jgi:hypothetical protein